MKLLKKAFNVLKSFLVSAVSISQLDESVATGREPFSFSEVNQI